MKNTTPPLVRLVDDDLTVAASLTFVLEVAGLQVRHYESARQFLAYDDPEREGCLLLDVRMPEMTGLELQTELNARASDLPVVFLSAHGNIEMAMSCVKAGAFDFLVKPPSPRETRRGFAIRLRQTRASSGRPARLARKRRRMVEAFTGGKRNGAARCQGAFQS